MSGNIFIHIPENRVTAGQHQTLAEGVKCIPITAPDSMLPATTYIPDIIYV